jgi:ketosteroid isomerase-like protein
MKPLLYALVLVTASFASASAQSNRARSVQEILVELEHDWDRAFLRKDVSFIERILADDFIATYPDGSRGDKQKELALVASLDQQIDSSTLKDFTVKVNGDSAIVWFTRTLVGPVQGKRTELTYRFLDVFVWREGRWQCLATQSTRVTAP